MLSDIHYMQRPLVFPPHNGTETSREAAEAAKPNIHAGEARVLRALMVHPHGLTRDQLASVTGMPTATVCARCNALIKLGEIEGKIDPDTGKKMKRSTKAGRGAEVLFVSSITTSTETP